MAGPPGGLADPPGGMTHPPAQLGQAQLLGPLPGGSPQAPWGQRLRMVPSRCLQTSAASVTCFCWQSGHALVNVPQVWDCAGL